MTLVHRGLVVMAALVGVGMGALWGSAGCEMFECRGTSFSHIEDGTYVVTDVVHSHAREWLLGAEVEVDHETVVIHYEHDGSTWEVRYKVDTME